MKRSKSGAQKRKEAATARDAVAKLPKMTDFFKITEQSRPGTSTERDEENYSVQEKEDYDDQLFTYVQIVVYFLNAAFQFYTSKVISPVRRGSCAYFGGGARSWSATGLCMCISGKDQLHVCEANNRY